MENKHDTAAELLVQPTKDAGMDIDAQDKEGKTVLIVCVRIFEFAIDNMETFYLNHVLHVLSCMCECGRARMC
jgi:hypothetical protein